jgi:mannose-6-phosphate isomerase-like protein (cupin superfamily)
MTDQHEPEGGDPACWAHLGPVESEVEASAAAGPVIDLAGLAARARHPGPAWSRRSDDLDVNLLVFPAGEGIERHINHEVDVLLVAISGVGWIEVGDEQLPIHPGEALLIPKGLPRAILASPEGLAYLSCHQRRRALLPSTSANRHARTT